MPVCNIVKLLPLSTVDDPMHYIALRLVQSSTAPWSNSFDYTANRHEIITVYYTTNMHGITV